MNRERGFYFKAEIFLPPPENLFGFDEIFEKRQRKLFAAWLRHAAEVVRRRSDVISAC